MPQPVAVGHLDLRPRKLAKAVYTIGEGGFFIAFTLAEAILARLEVLQRKLWGALLSRSLGSGATRRDYALPNFLFRLLQLPGHNNYRTRVTKNSFNASCEITMLDGVSFHGASS